MEKKTQTFEEYIKQEIHDGYTDATGQPLKCHHCNSVKPYKQLTISIDGGYVSEYAAICTDCGKEMGYWAYGNWQV
jgi:hypothetical protein